MDEKKESIIYAPIYFNLFLQIVYFILQYLRNKHHIKKLDDVKKEIIQSNQNIEEKKSNEDLEKIIIDVLKKQLNY